MDDHSRIRTRIVRNWQHIACIKTKTHISNNISDWSYLRRYPFDNLWINWMTIAPAKTTILCYGFHHIIDLFALGISSWLIKIERAKLLWEWLWRALLAKKKKKNKHDYTNESTKQVIDVIKRQTHSFRKFAHWRTRTCVRISWLIF